jgi:hypothetical protein
VAGAAAAGRPRPTEPLVLLTDLRDVVFQGDVFAGARNVLAAAGADAGSSGGSGGGGGGGDDDVSVLFAALESATVTLGTEPWNARSLAATFRPAVAASLAPLPVICSGTTIGGVRAVRTYLRAMIARFPVLMSGGPSEFGDQRLHNYLLHTAMLATIAAGAGATGDEALTVAARGPPPAAAPPPAGLILPPGVLAAYEKVYANLTALPRHLYASEPLYATLNAAAATLIPAQRAAPAAAPGAAGGRPPPPPRLTGVLVLPLRHEDGPVCTMGAVLHGRKLEVLPWARGGPGVGLGVVPTQANASRPCALIHQYDRSLFLQKAMDVALGITKPSVRYCDSDNPTVCV